MKLADSLQVVFVCQVTPFVGVWIETFCFLIKHKSAQVTPFVGVWIETIVLSFTINRFPVTPFVGVWIETLLLDTLPSSS